jgi:hypothetical protein
MHSMEELSAGVAEHVRVEELTWGESVKHVGRHRFDVVIACGARSHAMLQAPLRCAALDRAHALPVAPVTRSPTFLSPVTLP